MKRAYRLEFKQENGQFVPRDPELMKMAEDFCKAQCARMPNFHSYREVWVAVTLLEGKMVSVCGVIGYGMRPDIGLCRFVDQGAAKVLIDRIDSHFHDNGWRGEDVLLHFPSEDESQRCPEYREWFKAIGAKPAERFSIKVW